MSYRIFETDTFKDKLNTKNFKGQREKIRNKLKEFVYPQLQDNPFFGNNIKKLKGPHFVKWRYRVGDYRFFYTIDKSRNIVFMVSVAGRGQAYK